MYILHFIIIYMSELFGNILISFHLLEIIRESKYVNSTYHFLRRRIIYGSVSSVLRLVPIVNFIAVYIRQLSRYIYSTS